MSWAAGSPMGAAPRHLVIAVAAVAGFGVGALVGNGVAADPDEPVSVTASGDDPSSQPPSPDPDGSDDGASSSELSEPEPATPTPTPPPPTPTPTPTPPETMDPLELLFREARFLVRVEGFACRSSFSIRGYLTDAGEVLTSDLVLVAEGALFVTYGDGSSAQVGRVTRSTGGLAVLEPLGTPPEGSSTARTPEFPSDLLVLTEAAPGSPLEVLPADRVVAAADSVSARLRRAAGATVLGSPAYRPDGALVGIVTDAVGNRLTVGPVGAPQLAEPPVSTCSSDAPDAAPSDASLSSTRVEEIVLAQQLATALADDEWDLVRRLEPGRRNFTDAQFLEGWGDLEVSTLVPLSWDPGAQGTRIRALLVAHEVILSSRVTRMFCVTWSVDLASNAVDQTGDDPASGNPESPSFDPRLANRGGWVDPLEAAEDAADAC